MKFDKRKAPADFGAAPPEAVANLRWSASGASAMSTLADEDDAARGEVMATTSSVPVRSVSTDTGTLEPESIEAPPGWPIYLIALAVSLLWALGPVAFAVGYRGGVAPLQNDIFAIVVFALLAIGPAAFVWGAAYMIRQGQKLAAESRRARVQADEMVAPALVAAARAGDVAAAVRNEIAKAAAAAVDSRESLLALRDALALETEKLVEATSISQRTAQELTGALGRERTEMALLGQTLDGQAAKVTDAIAEQAKMVAQAADLAETQLREAEASLSARAADLAAAAGEAGDAARTAGEDLTRHIARLETAGLGVAEQVRACEGGLTEQRMALTTLAQALKVDNEGFADEAEAHAARLAEFISQARLSALEMSDRATKGGEALRALMSDAVEQFRDLAEMARAEREEFDQSTAHSLDAVSQAAADQRAKLEVETRAAIEALAHAAEQTREAAARHAVSAKAQVDQLSEAAFTAGQKANQVFEARLEEARALVELSAKMVDEAGISTARKLEDGALAAKATLEELNGVLGEIEQRAARLPASARAQVEQVQASVADGMDELMEQARRTASEAQAIDAAFQERVRRNFEMLTEAVRLMGVATVAAPVLSTPPPAALVEPVVDAPAPRTRKTAARPAAQPLAAPPEPEPVAASSARPRLRLTPTATDEEFSSVFEAAGGRTAEPAEPEEDGETWTWKDLLASLDGAESDGQRLEETLAAELVKMGVDPSKLLPIGRVDEIAAALQTGDIDGARQVVRRLAPAATRRIGRRLFTDDAVKRQVEIYVRRYQTLVDDTMVRDPEGLLLAEMLGADGGRLYLLLDAAAGDLV
ncbi:MAG: hypothetical protein JWO33_1531 [Caulobacteraceae bacterium]|nr:hypothetical protein [Caulobacteraceae bacterium]